MGNGCVSVIIPTLNEQVNVIRCIESAFRAGEIVGEVLVVDCSSTDGTAKIVEELAQTEPKLRLLISPERSYAAAVNLGVRCARYDRVQLLDGDSELSEGWLEHATRHLEATGADVVRGAIELRNDSVYGKVRDRGFRVSASSAGPGIFRTEVLRECNYDPSLKRSSDLDVHIRMDLRGYRTEIIVIPMLIKYDWDNRAINIRKSWDQGFYSAVMFTRNQLSPGYVKSFVALRSSYIIFSSFLLVGVFSCLLLTRWIMVLYWTAPFAAKMVKQRWTITQAVLWYIDWFARGGAFTTVVIRNPSALLRALRQLCVRI